MTSETTAADDGYLELRALKAGKKPHQKVEKPVRYRARLSTEAPLLTDVACCSHCTPSTQNAPVEVARRLLHDRRDASMAFWEGAAACAAPSGARRSRRRRARPCRARRRASFVRFCGERAFFVRGSRPTPWPSSPRGSSSARRALVVASRRARGGGSRRRARAGAGGTLSSAATRIDRPWQYCNASATIAGSGSASGTTSGFVRRRVVLAFDTFLPRLASERCLRITGIEGPL